jgi:putative DNA primase/helicase
MNFFEKPASRESHTNDCKKSLDAEIQAFSSALACAGLKCQEPIIPDGKIHRFYVEGDRAGSVNGWYVFFSDDHPAGAFGTWKSAEKPHTYSARGTRINDADRQKIREAYKQARIDHKVERHNINVLAAEKALEEWSNAVAAISSHPYLITKSVPPYGLRQIKHKLFVPLFDFYGKLWNIQTIFANGEKMFLKGGRVSGLFSPIAMADKSSQIIICEGWATGATLHQATGMTILCAMNAGNLLAVAQATRNQFPAADIIIAADNDRNTEGNPGLTKAKEAAMAVGARLAVPEFPSGVGGTDFNDLMKSVPGAVI